jgi:hypothetical protein
MNQTYNNKKTVTIILIVSGVIIVLMASFYLIFITKINNILNGTSHQTSTTKYATKITPSSLKKYTNNLTYDPKKPIVIKKNNKYGFISYTGKEIVKPIYDGVNEFYGNYTYVSKNNENGGFLDYIEFFIIDTNGKIKQTPKLNFEPYHSKKYDIWIINNVLYDGNFKQLSADNINVDQILSADDYGYYTFKNSLDNYSGIIDYTGKIIFKSDNFYIDMHISESEYDTKELFAYVNLLNKSVIISLKTGDILYTFEKGTYLYTGKNGSFMKANEDGTYNYYYFYNNKLALAPENPISSMELIDYKNMILEIDYYVKGLSFSSTTEYYDLKNNAKVTDTSLYKEDYGIEKRTLNEVNYGYKEIEENNLVGLSFNGNTVIPCNYKYINFFNKQLFNYLKKETKQELAYFEDKDKTNIMDIKTQKVIVSYKDSSDYYNYTSPFINYISTINGVDTKIVLNLLSGKSLKVSLDDNISYYYNYLDIYDKTNKKDTIYNYKLQKIYEINE